MLINAFHSLLQGLLYFSEVRSKFKSIRRMNIAVPANNSIVVVGTGVVLSQFSTSHLLHKCSLVIHNHGGFSGLAADWMTDNIYYADFTNGQIWVARDDGAYQKLLIFGLNQPQALTLDIIHK